MLRVNLAIVAIGLKVCNVNFTTPARSYQEMIRSYQEQSEVSVSYFTHVSGAVSCYQVLSGAGTGFDGVRSYKSEAVL